jgi:hypothetical protein
MSTWIVDPFTYKKLEFVTKHLHGNGSSLTIDQRRDLANIMSDVMSCLEEIPDPMTDEEQAMAHEEARHGEGANYSEADWVRWLAERRKK